MKIIRLLLAILFGFVCCFGWQFFRDCGVQPQVEQQIPTVEDIQTMLVEQGYDVGEKGVDGRYGKDTKLAHDKAICQQEADKSNSMYGAK